VHCQLCNDPKTAAFAVGNYVPEAPHEVRVAASPLLLDFCQLTKLERGITHNAAGGCGAWCALADE